MQLGNITEEELQAQCLESGCLYFMFCPLMSLCPFLGLPVSTFARGVSEMNSHQTQMLFPTSVACLDGKTCDNSQKKVNSPVAMETSYRFFLFLFLPFAVNGSVQNPAGWQPGTRLSPARPRQGTNPVQSQELSLCTLSPKDLFQGAAFSGRVVQCLRKGDHLLFPGLSMAKK